MLDIISITVESGKWWDGCVAARREAWVPFGWPAGGDGGKWGDVIFVATSNEHTLSRFRYHHKVEADDGEDGRIKDQYGANADDRTIPVPLGTVVKDTQSGTILFQFTHDGEEYIVAHGGRGWAGNIHFANAIQQYPNFALLGEPGQKKDITLELQILWDVWLIGTPSVGKSSLINSCCATRAKTADYHFTTLEPAIGICDQWAVSFSIVDIPWLIAGASEGKWLWNDFLRHVLKAKVFALVADMSRYEQSFNELTTVIDEIFMYIHQRFLWSKEFGEEIQKVELTVSESQHQTLIISCRVTAGQHTWILFDKAIHILVNKYDMVNDMEIAQEFVQSLCMFLQKHLADRRWLSLDTWLLVSNSFIVTAATHMGIHEWINKVSYLLSSISLTTMTLFDTVDLDFQFHTKVKDITEQDLPYLLDEWYIDPTTAKRAKVREIHDEEISRLVFTLPRGNDQAEHRFWRVMTKQHHLIDFEKAGVMHGDILKVKTRYSGQTDKYILYNV